MLCILVTKSAYQLDLVTNFLHFEIILRYILNMFILVEQY